MAGIKDSPQRTKQRVLEYLKNRGGVLRSGQAEIHQLLFWKCFRKGSDRSHHDDVTTMETLIRELEAEGEVVLRQSTKGLYNYIALKSTDQPNSGTGSELSNEELQELFATMSTEYSYMNQALEKAQEDADESLRLATEYEVTATTAQAEKAMLEAELAQIKSAHYDLQKTASFEEVRKILAEQESELAQGLSENRMLKLSIAENLAEIERLSEKLEVEQSQNKALQGEKEILQKSVKELAKKLKMANKQSQEKIDSLKRELAACEKGDGLTATKAAAAALFGIGDAMNNIWRDATDIIVNSCLKHLPEDKHENFKKEMSAAYDKMCRRASS